MDAPANYICEAHAGLVSLMEDIKTDTATTRRIIEGTNGEPGLKTRVVMNEQAVAQHAILATEIRQAKARAFWAGVAALSVSIVTLIFGLLGTAGLAAWTLLQP